MSWQPIETARTHDAKADDDGSRHVLLAYAPTGTIWTGMVKRFVGDDGTIRLGTSAGFAIRLATHWMPLPEAPQ